MAATVLNSRAIETSILVVRAFIHAREILSEHRELKRRLDRLEEKVARGFQELGMEPAFKSNREEVRNQQEPKAAEELNSNREEMRRLQEELQRLMQSGKLGSSLSGIKDIDSLRASINQASSNIKKDGDDELKSKVKDNNKLELDLRSDAFNALKHSKDALEQLRVYVLPKGSLVPVDIAELVTRLEKLNKVAMAIVSDPYNPEARNLSAYSFGEEPKAVKKAA